MPSTKTVTKKGAMGAVEEPVVSVGDIRDLESCSVDDMATPVQNLDSRQEVDDGSEEPIIKINPAHFSVTVESIRRRLTIPVYRRMPNTAFGIAMGLAAYSILWKTASNAPFVLHNSKPAELLNYIFWLSAIVVGSIIGILYILKWICYPKFVKDEWKHPVRLHFSNVPHLVLLMLSIGVPSNIEAKQVTLRSIWGLCFVAQIGITQSIYHRWLFSINSTINSARPQYLLSTVGWFLLSVLGQQTDIRSAWGLNLPIFCFGAGAMFYVMVVFSIFSGLHLARDERHSPALFMLCAPPSVAAIALDLMDGDPDTFSDGACMLLGLSLIMLILVIRNGPKIIKKPHTMGTYWAYVFPVSSVANLTIRYAEAESSTSARVMAIFFMLLATLTLTIILARTCWHQVLVMKGKERWGDPLVDKRYIHKSSSVLEVNLGTNN